MITHKTYFKSIYIYDYLFSALHKITTLSWNNFTYIWFSASNIRKYKIKYRKPAYYNS